MKKIVILLVLLILTVVGVFFASPYWTLYQLKTAYENHDSQMINQHINFTRVQTDIKSQLKPVLVKKVQTLTQSPLAKMLNLQVDETDMVEKLINQAVSNAITPAGVTNILTVQDNLAKLDNNVKLLGGLTVVAMDKIKINQDTLASLITARSPEELNQKLMTQLQSSELANGAKTTKTETTAKYCGINCFEVQGQIQGYPMTVNLERQGLVTWKVVGVKLPI